MKWTASLFLIMAFLLAGCGEISGQAPDYSEVLSSSGAASTDLDMSPSSWEIVSSQESVSSAESSSLQEPESVSQQEANRELTQSQKDGIAAAVKDVLRKYQMGEYPLDIIYNSDASRFIGAFPKDSSYPERVTWEQFTVTQYYDPGHMYAMSLTLPLDNGYAMNVILDPSPTVLENGSYISPDRGDTTAEWMVFDASFSDSRGARNIAEKTTDIGRFADIRYDRTSITADVLELQLSEIQGIFSGYLRYSCFSEYLIVFLQDEDEKAIYFAADFLKERLYRQQDDGIMAESSEPDDWRLASECLDILNELWQAEN